MLGQFSCFRWGASSCRAYADLDLHYERLNYSARAMGFEPTMEVDQIIELVNKGLSYFDDNIAIYIRPMYWAYDRDQASGFL